MATAILLPTSLGGLVAERLLLAVADRLNVAGADAALRQGALHRACPAVAQRQVVLGGSALVAVSLDHEVDVGMLRQESYIRLQRSLLVSANIGFVVIKVDVLNVLREQLFLARTGRGGRRRRRRRSHGNPCRSLLRAAGSFRGKRVGRGIGRVHLLRAAGLHRSNSVDAHIRGIRGLPGEGGCLSLLDGVWIRRKRGRRRGWWRWRRWWRWCCLLMASAKEQNGAQREYECSPLHSLLLHFSSVRKRAPLPFNALQNPERGGFTSPPPPACPIEKLAKP